MSGMQLSPHNMTFKPLLSQLRWLRRSDAPTPRSAEQTNLLNPLLLIEMAFRSMPPFHVSPINGID